MRTLAIIVNYFSASLALKAVRSILESGSAGPVDIVVVDNSEDTGQAEQLKEGLSPGCRIIVPDVNLGFGRACNLVLEGNESEAVLLLNPDARLLPGALKKMQKFLFSLPRAGAVGPQVYWDEDMEFFLPPSYPPQLYLWQSIAVRRGQTSLFYKALSRRWRRFALRVWRAKKPLSVPALSGGHMLIKSEALKKAKGLFDPDFFMYFEDTDLCKRLMDKGFKLYMDPAAEATHDYGACGRDGSHELKNDWMIESRKRFENKHGTNFFRFLKLIYPGKDTADPVNNYDPDFHGPFEINIPDYLQDGWLFEWSPNNDFIPSAGKFGQGSKMLFSKKQWDQLNPGRYFGRIGKASVLSKDFQVFSWMKQS